MSERMFASGGDSVSGGRLEPGRAPYREDRLPTDDAAAGVLKRLQARLDRHQRLLGQLPSDSPHRRELTETARRMRRDVDSLILLCGDEPSTPMGSRRLSDVLEEAAAAAEETWRILVRPTASATVAPTAAAEFVLAMAEVLDHVTAAYPDAGIDVASYVVQHTGLTVEVSVNGAGRYAPDGLGTVRAATAAQAHVRRSRSGLSITLPSGAPPPGGTGVVASISAPASAVTIEEPVWSSMATVGNQPLPAVSPAGTNGNGYHGSNGSGGVPSLNQPDYAPSPSSHVDELFGPIVDLPYQAGDGPEGTPIFEAIASAWFQDERDSGEPKSHDADPVNWETPADTEWRAAAARATQSEPLSSTASGLPRRRPGNQLVPPPRSRSTSVNEPAERVPDRVRNRLSNYQRGLRQGRHRAPGPESDG